MKKQLLLGSALLAAISAFPQQAVPKGVGHADVGAYLSQKFEMQLNAAEAAKSVQSVNKPQYGPEENPSVNARSSSSKIAAYNSWKGITGSMNIYGSIIPNSKVLTYNDELNTVSYIHRKAPGYLPNPFPIPQAESGAIVGVFSDDWGNTWDTTLLWNDDTNWGRYPQGGIWNIPGAKCLFDSAYMIATGPLTPNAGGWVGSYLASKQLDTMGGPRNSDSVSPTLSAIVFATNSGTNLPYGKFDFPRYDFSVTDDGAVRTLGILANNINGTGAAYGFKGASVVKGKFISGSFTWMTDSIQPKVLLNSAGSQLVSGQPHMCWNESGTVGYVWFIGVRDTVGLPDSMVKGSNMSYQPIVFKTTNSGATWSEMPKMNFNTKTNAFDDLFKHMLAVKNDSIGVPYFNVGEGVDGIVDRNDRLHIVASIFSSSTAHVDSLSYVYTFNNADGERYWYSHTPKFHPYIYDFTETGNGWRCTLIDSMSSEAPGTTTGTDGYGDNPWDPTGGGNGTDKVEVNARIQLSRTPDGRYIIYTFAESDTGLTFLSHKWNSLPNIKARMAEVGVETSTAVPAPLTVHPMEINVTSVTNSVTTPPYTESNSVKNRAYMHYVSPKCAVISNPAALPNVAIGLPVSVSNSSPLKQYAANTHWYLSANLNFGNVSSVDWPANQCLAPKDTSSNPDDTTVVDGIAQRVKNIMSSQLFPNPTTSSAQLAITLENGSNVTVQISNTMGQVVSTVNHKGVTGANIIDLNVGTLASGVYMVNIKVGDATGTKRLLIQH
jgi:hypothetical protein